MKAPALLLVAALFALAAPLSSAQADRGDQGGTPPPAVQQALRDLARGKDAAANVETLKHFVEQAADPGAAATQFGVLLFQEQHFAPAQLFLEIARARNPKDGTVAFLLGKAHAAQFHYEQGLEHLTAANELMPPGPHPYVDEYLSKVLIGLQRADEAVARARLAIDEATKLNGALAAGQKPLDLTLFELNLAEICQLGVRYDEALLVADQLAKRPLTDEQQSKLAHLRATVFEARGDPESAAAAFARARALTPADIDAHYESALFFIRRGELAPARPLLEKVIELDADHEGAHFNLGRTLLRLGDKELGQKMLARYQQIHDARLEADRQLTELSRRLSEVKSPGR